MAEILTDAAGIACCCPPPAQGGCPAETDVCVCDFLNLAIDNITYLVIDPLGPAVECMTGPFSGIVARTQPCKWTSNVAIDVGICNLQPTIACFGDISPAIPCLGVAMECVEELLSLPICNTTPCVLPECGGFFFAGDVRFAFPIGSTVTVAGTAQNDGVYTVSDVRLGDPMFPPPGCGPHPTTFVETFEPVLFVGGAQGTMTNVVGFGVGRVTIRNAATPSTAKALYKREWPTGPGLCALEGVYPPDQVLNSPPDIEITDPGTMTVSVPP